MKNVFTNIITGMQKFLNLFSPKGWLGIWCLGMLAGLAFMILTSYGFAFIEWWGFITCVLIFFYYVLLPVKKNQILYGGNTKSMLVCVTVLIISLLFTISGANSILLKLNWGADPKNLIHLEPPTQVVYNDSARAKSVVYPKDTAAIKKSKGFDNTNVDSAKISVRDFDDDFSPASKNFWAVVSQFADPGNLPQARGYSKVLAILLAFLGIFCLSGLMISSLVDFLSKRRQNWLQGLILYKKNWSLKNYVLIVGINEQTASIVTRSLRREGVENILIQTRKDVEKARMTLGLSLEDELEDKIVFYSGERTSVEDIAKLRLERAVEIYILGEDIGFENEKDHDSFNLNCLEHMSDYISSHEIEFKTDSRKRRIHVDFEYQSTFTAFKATNLFNKLNRNIEFVPFNVHEIWSKKVLVDNFAIVPSGGKSEVKVQRYYPIDTYIDDNGNRVGITEECDKTVHLMIFGMNQMGTALATQAALLCHFPNFVRDKSLRTTITFIDDHAKEEADFFMGRYSTLFELCRYRILDANDGPIDPETDYEDPMSEGVYDHLLGDGDDKGESFLDIQWEFIQGNIASKRIQNYIRKVAADKSKTTTISICFNHSQQSIASAMYLPADVFNNANQVLVYQQNIFDVVNDVAGGDSEWNKYKNLFPFGMIESSYTENQYDNSLAKLLNYFYKCHFVDFLQENSLVLLDDVDSSWDEIEIVQKLSNIDSVDSIPAKIRSLGVKSQYDYAEIERKVEEKGINMFVSEHMRWLTERLINGFRCLTISEQQDIACKSGIQRKNQKTLYKNQMRAHLDICSSNRILEIDNDSGNNDHYFIKYLPKLLKGREKINALHLFSDRYIIAQHVAALKNVFGNRKHQLFHFIKGLDGAESTNKGPNYSFWMSKIAVTQEQWKLVTGQEKHDYAGKNMPVVNVSKRDIDDFIDILRKKTGISFSLPTKNEWRYAAEKSRCEDDFVNLQNENIGMPVPVASRCSHKKSCPIFHMLGNVWEWTCSQDEHGRYEFCGASFRFQKRDIEIEKFNDNEVQYWHNPWDMEMKSDDLGFRLIWRFEDKLDIDNNEDKDLRDKIKIVLAALKSLIWSSSYSTNASAGEQVCNWFNQKNHKMELVKAGQFTMGKKKNVPEGKNNYIPDANETPEHDVKFSSDYFMCQVPVTQGLWNILSGGKKYNPTTNRICDNVPQTNVSWKDVSDFIEKLNELKDEGKLNPVMDELDRLLPSGTSNLVFRLPTEAEWEYAAKGGDNKSECLYSGSDSSELVAWYEQPTIQEVAQKKENELKLFDMSGNVWEWCYDYYIFDMYDACIGNGDSIKIQEVFERGQYMKNKYIIDPVALDDSYSAHVFRGGSWRSTEWDCRCSRANFWNAEHRSDDLGFRLVLGRKIKEFQGVKENIKEVSE